MPLPGRAFIALWNSTTADASEYSVWHRREHGGERLSVPGFLSARRYVRRRGMLPICFSFYGLDAIDVVAREADRRLVDTPSRWSLAGVEG